MPNKFKVNNRNVVLVSFLLTLNIFDAYSCSSGGFFVVVVVADFKHVKAAWNTLLPLSKFASVFQSQI